MEYSDWQKLYSGNWKGTIVDAAFVHPAKYSRKLIRHIYKHAIEEGWLKPGDLVIDPFGGVALGSIDAMRNGLHWIGVELERHFVQLGTGFDCPGFSKRQWRRYHGRAWRAFKNSGNWLFCPDCAARIDASPSVRIIPDWDEHHWSGNIDSWNEKYSRHFPDWGSAILLQGDSRRLLDVIVNADAAIASPPYIGINIEKNSKSINIEKNYETYRASGGGLTLEKFIQLQQKHSANYGRSEGQLGVMPAGNFDAAISSPPFSQPGEQPTFSQTRAIKDYHAFTRGDGTKKDHTMRSEGQLGIMPTGDFDAAISSPPYSDGCSHEGGNIPTSKDHIQGGPINLPGISGVVSSPPYSDRSIPPTEIQGYEAADLRMNEGETYGKSSGQLGAMPPGDFDAAISSPPFIDTEAAHSANKYSDPEKVAEEMARKYQDGTFSGHAASKDAILRSLQRAQSQEYGNSYGQLGIMPAGDFDASISSPPFEQQNSGGGIASSMIGESDYEITSGGMARTKKAKRSSQGVGYSNQAITNENLAANTGEDFWSAARLIVEQTFAALRPGAHAIFVVKQFVKNGAIVEFPDQWRRLCEAVGFVSLHYHRAWLVEDRGKQYDLFGELHEFTVQRKSFFRILTEKRGSPRIDFEVVLCMQKPSKDIE